MWSDWVKVGWKFSQAREREKVNRREKAFFSIDCRRELTPLRVRETGGGIARFNLSQERSRDAISSVFDCCLSPYRAKGIKEWIPGESSRRDRTESTVTDRKLDSQANQTDLPQKVRQRISFLFWNSFSFDKEESSKYEEVINEQSFFVEIVGAATPLPLLT